MEQEVLEILRELNDEVPNDVQKNLFEEGVIDSFDIVNIVSALEEHYGIEIPAEDIVPENFRSAAKMAAMVRTVQGIRDSGVISNKMERKD